MGGTLAGTTATLQGNILNNAAVTFIGGGIYAGSMSGSGSLAKTGAGTLILSGTNGYSGGTTVSAGVLQGNTASLQGNILNNASVVFNQTGGGIYAGTMSGTGSLALTGNGLLNLTGNNTFTGGTTVSGGTLAVNGSLASGVTVGAAGTLGGNGTITGTVVNAGVLAPGNSIGTLTVNGSYTQAAGSTYQVEANAAGQADRINVTGAPGTATINGGTVQVLAQPGNYAQQHHLHHPQRDGRRQRHLRRGHQQLRLPDAVAGLRRQQRVPHPGDRPECFQLRRPHAQPEGGRHRRSTSPSPRPAATSPRC